MCLAQLLINYYVTKHLYYDSFLMSNLRNLTLAAIFFFAVLWSQHLTMVLMPIGLPKPWAN